MAEYVSDAPIPCQPMEEEFQAGGARHGSGCSTPRRVRGTPGEIIGDRPVISFNHAAGRPIATPHPRVLRRPVESALPVGVSFHLPLTMLGILLVAVGLTLSLPAHPLSLDPPTAWVGELISPRSVVVA